MYKFNKLCLFIMFNIAILPYTCFAKEQVLTLSVAESIVTHSNVNAYCLFEKTFHKMGYKVEQVPIPLIRTISETQKGNIAMVLVGQINIETQAKPKSLEQGVAITSAPYSTQGIAITSAPYSTMGISSYTLKDRNILMNKLNWQSAYKIGLARNPHSHDIREHDANNISNYYFYNNTLSALKAVLKGRIDIVIVSDLAYASSKDILKLDDKIKKVAFLGIATLYLGFSYKYFGEEKAKLMAKNYENQRTNLNSTELKQCNKSM